MGRKKAKATFNKHGITFDEATEVFDELADYQKRQRRFILNRTKR